MTWLALLLLLYATKYITCTDTDQEDYFNKDKGLLFDAFPGFILSFPINTKDIQQQTIQVPDKMGCVYACSGVPWCRSMNFQTTAPNNYGLHVCELISTDKHEHPKNMIKNNNFIHLSVQNPCAEIPCLNGGKCRLQKNRQDYRCKCKKGYDGNTCQNDVDECTSGTHNCHSNATCTNIAGSFTCKCKLGYQGNGVTCSEDKCIAGSHNCHSDATCTNTAAGSFTCQCKPGYQGNGVTCSDVDECTAGIHNCHSSQATCTNTAGSFTCQCKPGYQVTCSGPTSSFSSGNIYSYAVPSTRKYLIRAGGARGGTHSYNYSNNPRIYYGGKGATINGLFSLSSGTVLNVVVGGRGGNSVEVRGGQKTTQTAAQLGLSVEDNAGTGGGGGSFVYTTSNVLLIAAGGGGGASGGYNGVDGQAGTKGTASVGLKALQVGAGSSGGNPGACNSAGASYHGGWGAGWNGQGCKRLGASHGDRGGSRLQGWVGGVAGSMNSGYNGGPAPGAVGGFGGGGGGSEDNGASGGGGGYSGGGSGSHSNQAGGGGGSYCNGTSCCGETGGNSNDYGFVHICIVS